jgi:hypothetical protein
VLVSVPKLPKELRLGMTCAVKIDVDK